MTPRMWLRTILAVKRGIDVAYDKDLERVLVETRTSLAKIKDLPIGPLPSRGLLDVIDKLDETIDTLKNRKLNPFNMEDKP